MTISNISEKVCGICQDETNKAVRVPVSCQHLFHEACIKPWALQKPLCPLCRTKITQINGVDLSAQATVRNKDQEDFEEAFDLAASFGALPAILLWLDSGREISEELRGKSIRSAAIRGHLEIVVALLPGATAISPRDRGLAVIDAATEGHHQIVKFLFNRNAQISEEDRGIAVQNAAANNHFNIVQSLLSNSASIPQRCREIALQHAVSFGQSEMVELLLEGPVSKEHLSKALMEAWNKNFQKIVLVLDAHSPDSFGGLDKEERSWAIVTACHRGSFDIALHWIARSDISEYQRGLALNRAVYLERLDVVQALLPDLSASISEEHHIQALITAANLQDPFILQLLLDYRPVSDEAYEKAFLRAAQRGRLENLSILLVFRPLPDGDPGLAIRSEAIRLAATDGHTETVKFLLEGHRVLPGSFWLAVEQAALKGYANTLAILLSHLSLDPSLASERRFGNAVIWATQNGRKEAVKALLASEQPLTEERRGFAVRDAASQGFTEIVNLLLDQGGISEHDRGTAVRNAASQGHAAIVKRLLRNGAISKEHREEALLKAVEFGHLESVQALFPNKGPILEQISEEAYIEAFRLASRSASDPRLLNALINLLLVAPNATPLSPQIRQLFNALIDQSMQQTVEKGNFDFLAYPQILMEDRRGAAVIQAAGQKNAALIKRLMNGAVISRKDYGEALLKAVALDHFEGVRALTLSRFRAFGKDYQEALLLAVKKGHSQIVDVLLLRGLVSQANQIKALFFAARNGHADIVKILLSRNTIPQSDCHDALDLALRRGFSDVAHVLFPYVSKEKYGELFVLSAERGWYFPFLLLAPGATVTQDQRGAGVLRATRHLDFRILQTLLKSGPISEIARNLAIFETNSKIAKALLADKPISEDDRDSDILRTGDSSIMKKILATGSISERARGLAVVEAAKKGCYFETIKLLLESGPISEDDRNTALKLAFDVDSIEVLQTIRK